MNLFMRTLTILKPALTDDKVRRLLLINIGIVLLAIAAIFGIVHWRSYFIDAVQAKDAVKFGLLLAVFAVIAGILVVTRGFQAYVAKLIEFRSREVLFKEYIERFTRCDAPTAVNNPEQRLAQDTALVPRIAGSLFFGGLEAVINVVVFGVMTYLVGPWFTIPALLVYVIGGMVIAKRIGQPLIKLDYEQQTREAKLYQRILQWLPNSSISKSKPDLHEVSFNWLALAKRSKLLGFFTSSHSQLGNVLPMILLSPVYFKGAITMGILWSATDAAGRLTDALAFIIDKREDLNLLAACVTRLEELHNDTST